LGYSEALELLKANEAEEKAADAALTKLAESTINRQARAAGDENNDEQRRKHLSSRRDRDGMFDESHRGEQASVRTR
jgi:hypothetical protein